MVWLCIIVVGSISIGLLYSCMVVGKRSDKVIEDFWEKKRLENESEEMEDENVRN